MSQFYRKEKYYCKYTTLPAPLQELYACDPIAALRTTRRYGKIAPTFMWCSACCEPEGLLEPNDNPPGGQSSRTVTIHLTRDTLLLIAALAFLTVAILLAVIFPSASSSTPNPSGAGVAQSGTSPPDGRATTAAI